MRFYTYDNQEDITRCLNCEKAECNNCYGNFFSAGLEDYDEEEREDSRT